MTLKTRSGGADPVRTGEDSRPRFIVSLIWHGAFLVPLVLSVPIVLRRIDAGEWGALVAWLFMVAMWTFFVSHRIASYRRSVKERSAERSNPHD
jgi:hypothetical protein